MATMNLDNLVINLQARQTAKQGRIAVSEHRVLPMPPAVMSPVWRHPSPSSFDASCYRECLVDVGYPPTATEKPRDKAGRTGGSGSPISGGGLRAS
jgi:hypothetical protein